MAQAEDPTKSSGSIDKRPSRFVKGLVSSGGSFLKPPNNDGEGIVGILAHPINVLLIAFPFGIMSHIFGWGHSATFWTNFLALIPLAKILGDATEELAAGLKNDMIAGLLNATFGNAVEMVIMINTLRAGLIDVVKATLLGSVLSNLLLVLGMSFFCGGLVRNVKKKIQRQTSPGAAAAALQTGNYAAMQTEGQEARMEIGTEKVQTFSIVVALVNTSMLLLSCLSFSLVTVFHESTHVDGRSVMDSVLLPVSRICSIIIICAYVAYIFFQLVTHREAMTDGDDDDGDEKEEPAITITAAVLMMSFTTLVVAFSSELLVNSLDGVVEEAGISQHFIGIILLPIVGNACEHASAIRFAVMDKPGLSIGIAVGSSTQISLFVVPCAVLIGWLIDQPMDLNFGSLNVTVMSISVIVVLSVVVDGQANWLQGYLLMSSYVIVGVLFWFLPNELPEKI